MKTIAKSLIGKAMLNWLTLSNISNKNIQSSHSPPPTTKLPKKKKKKKPINPIFYIISLLSSCNYEDNRITPLLMLVHGLI